MAIGSAPEYGTIFTQWGKMRYIDQLAWYDYMLVHWGLDLMGGYGKIVYPNRERMKEIDAEWAAQESP